MAPALCCAQKKDRRQIMPDYQKMYHILCDAAARALDALPETVSEEAARFILQQGLLEAEELYIRAEE